MRRLTYKVPIHLLQVLNTPEKFLAKIKLRFENAGYQVIHAASFRLLGHCMISSAKYCRTPQCKTLLEGKMIWFKKPETYTTTGVSSSQTLGVLLPRALSSCQALGQTYLGGLFRPFGMTQRTRDTSYWVINAYCGLLRLLIMYWVWMWFSVTHRSWQKSVSSSCPTCQSSGFIHSPPSPDLCVLRSGR